MYVRSLQLVACTVPSPSRDGVRPWLPMYWQSRLQSVTPHARLIKGTAKTVRFPYTHQCTRANIEMAEYTHTGCQNTGDRQ